MVTLDADLHLVALNSVIGWKTHLELPNKEDRLVESFSSLEVHTAEKKLLKYSEAMSKTSWSSWFKLERWILWRW